MNLGVFAEELIHPLGLVRREVISDDVNLLSLGLVGHNVGQEGDKFGRRVALCGLAQDLASLGVERGIQRQRAVALALSNAALDVQVASRHAESKRSYGRRRIMRGPRAQGSEVGHERVRKSLRRQGLRPVYRRPYWITTKCDPGAPMAGNVLDRRFECWALNRAWVADISVSQQAA
jgi:hypothetical protein